MLYKTLNDVNVRNFLCSAICDLILVSFCVMILILLSAHQANHLFPHGVIFFFLLVFSVARVFHIIHFSKEKKRQLMGDCLISVELMGILDDSVDVKL